MSKNDVLSKSMVKSTFQKSGGSQISEASSDNV